MAREMLAGKGKSEQHIAQMAGILASTNSFAKALISLLWGRISDSIGRKVHHE